MGWIAIISLIVVRRALSLARRHFFLKKSVCVVVLTYHQEEK